MKLKSLLSMTIVSSVALVGCDQCSGSKEKKSDPVSQGTTSQTPPPSDATGPAESTPALTEASPAPTDSSTPTSDPSAVKAEATQPAAGTDAPAKAEVQIVDIKMGKGPEAVDGKRVTVHYTGTLENGTKFDSSKDRGTPFPFILGSGMVITGWEKGLLGMKEGGVRKLVIPPSLAYGEKSVGGVIPPNSTLVFEIELLKVE